MCRKVFKLSAKAKGYFFFLNVGREGGAPLHNAAFDFNEEALSSGVETYCRIALELLGRKEVLNF